ncbi:hypothetical protein [Amycolatopsis thailandensis]|uniref:hypothetical protein n=1 Tax=Amycolatopsis thailandensis TaxID=589330 RepID=UPI00363F56C0
MSESARDGGTVATLEAQQRASEPGKSAKRGLFDKLPLWALWALTALPILLSITEVLRAPKINHADYWVVLGLTADTNGNLDVAQLFHLYHEHPIVLVGLVFWLDAKLFAGTQTPLGFLSVVLAAGMFAALWSMLPRTLTGLRRAGVVAGLSGLVFSAGTVEYFGDGMMGVQWLLGLAPAVIAIAFAHHGKLVPAFLFAFMGSLGHGVAFPVWIVLALVLWLRGESRIKTALPLGLGLVVFILWRVAPWPPSYQKPNVVGADTYLGAMTSTIGQSWSTKSPDLAFLAGALTVGLFGLLIAAAVKQRLAAKTENFTGTLDGPAPVAAVAGWFGLAAQVTLNGAMIGVSRGGYNATEGMSSRYVGIGLLGVCAVLVLLVTRGPRALRLKAIPLALVMALCVYAIGNTAAGATRYRYAYQPVLAVAMHVNAGGVMAKMFAYTDFLEQERKMGIYPFTPDFTLGCGAGGPELGTTVDLAKAVELKGPGYGTKDTAGAVDTAPVTGDKQINGWALIGGQQAQCILITDGGGKVVGGGTVGLPRDDISQFMNGTGRSGWQAVAAPEVKDPVVLAYRDGVYHRITTIKDAGKG